MSFMQVFLSEANFLSDGGHPPCTAEESGPSLKATSGYNPAPDAANLEKAIKAKGVDEGTIIDILTKRTSSERQQIKAAYQQQTGKSLDDALKKALSSHLEEVVLGLMKTPAQFDAHCLKTAVKVILPNFFTRYCRYSKNDMAKALDLELKGDIENCLISLVKCIISKPAYFAEKFFLAMKGSGTKHKDLIRLLVSRCEIDLKEIKTHYKRLYGKSLRQAIMEEKLKGDYETIVLALCGPDN
ncbi:hypothetical protein GDO78_015073 [Eleutherodactylus coqui]|uniref:Annexin n=1 Tax=Eleutherodactylus coqui TaxID=57060 RepID=A0A8J6JK66_ELECQ|nr:hypothetical protein GDO78_015073 [Eleutherodactylus coqui]